MWGDGGKVGYEQGIRPHGMELPTSYYVEAWFS